ncbi:MAG: hypothetical protein PHH32_03190 [Eubacteriales bacterium]|nr:hypothetical protein [Eubacteriales bacterium]
MKGPWKVTSNLIIDQKQYQVYRLRDMNEVDHSGNREYGSDLMTDLDAAKAIADRLNTKEGR